jgi:hypothetical protein
MGAAWRGNPSWAERRGFERAEGGHDGGLTG